MITLNRVEVFGDTPNETIASLKDDSLLAAIFRPGAPTVADKRVMSGGTRAIVYMWFTLDPAGALPKSVHHRFLFSIARADGESVERDVDAMWLAAFGPSSSSRHRRALIPAFGQTGISGRFAIDWLKLGDDGKLFHGDATVNANWYGYGTEVLSVGDAVVTAVKDRIPEIVPFSTERAVPITLDTIVLESFTLLDTAKDLREVIERGWNAPVPPKPEKRQREMPLENEVVEFD